MGVKISCIICAYNEANRIADVLRVVTDHPLISETIVVDDGSRDGTADVVRTFSNARLIINEENRGKTASYLRAVTSAVGDLILALDADLKNLSAENVAALIEPVLSGRADTSVSLRGNSLPIYRFIGLDFVSGERLLPRTLVTDHTEEIARLPRFGIESYLNRLIIERRMRIAIVHLDNVVNTRKSEKIGWWRGTLKEWAMIWDIVRVISLYELVRQNYMMLKLSRLVGARSPAKASADLSQE